MQLKGVYRKVCLQGKIYVYVRTTLNLKKKKGSKTSVSSADEEHLSAIKMVLTQPFHTRLASVLESYKKTHFEL